MRTLNLGILAHVDAGKTTLTERLLYAAGVIDEIGSVDDGSTQTDTLALERQRGITIKSAVVSFVIHDVTVNLIDTPGHPDFIAEVERVVSVLDGAVLVISAVEGVQPQTRVLMRALQRLHIPTLIFVNKIDRGGAQYERVLQNIAEKLTPAIIPMGWARDLGTRSPGFTPYGAADVAFAARLADLLAYHDDAFLAAYVDDETTVSYWRLRDELGAQTRQALVHPVFFGSAITGAGVDSLIAGVTELLPAAEGDVDGPVSGTVFKVERGPAGEKIAYVRMFSGTVRTRDRVQCGRGNERTVTAISLFDRGVAAQSASVAAGRIAKLWGLGRVQIGDPIGISRTTSERHHFAPPTLETVVVPLLPGEKGALQVALAQLAEQDPLINLRQDDTRHELFVSLYGEVQKEVIQATLANDFNIDVGFRETTPICIERPIGTGAAVEVLQEETNPTSATVGPVVKPAPVGSGVTFQLDVDPRFIPLYIYKTTSSFVEHMTQYVRSSLHEGLFGWQVTDCTVTMNECNYYIGDGPGKPSGNTPRTIAADFRILAPLVLMAALTQASTVVCEPVHRFYLEVPADTFGATAPVLARLRAVPQTQEMRGSSYVLEGEIPAARVHELQRQLPALTRGEGVLECAFDRYQPVRGTIPTRPRSDPQSARPQGVPAARHAAGLARWEVSVKNYEPVMSFGKDVGEGDPRRLRGDEDATVAFLRERAGDGPALELAIGAGRIARPLAAQGVRVDGIDISQAMVDVLRTQPGGDAIAVTMGDYADVPVAGTYRLIYIVYNTIHNLLTQDDQVRCFQNVAAHLTDDGSFVVEAQTHASLHLADNQYVHAQPIEVNQVWLDVARYDPVTQLLEESHVSLTADGVRLYPIVTRQVWPSEMDLMARIAGLRLKERWGGWNREPFTSTSSNLVSVYGR